MSSARDVWELSRHVALEGADGVVAVLKAYLDESGIHDNSPVCTVAAYLARPKQWREWTKRWNVAKQPIKVFHAVDCANYTNEFKGWNEEDRDKFVANLLPIIAESGLPGIVIGLHIDEFEKALKGRNELRDYLGSPYACCVQWVMQIIMIHAYSAGSRERIGFIHENNDFQKDALEGFNYVQKFGNPYQTKMSLTFGGKKDYAPLQAADILAYEGNKRIRNPKAPERRAWTALDPDKTRIACWHYGKGNIRELVQRLETIHKGDIGSFTPSASWQNAFPDLPRDWGRQAYWK